MVLFEFRQALKDLGRRPRFSLTVVLTIAIVVGSGGALFSLLHAFVLRTLPVREPGRLVAVYAGVGEALFGVPGPMLTALRQQQDTFESLCGIARSAYAVDLGGALSMQPAELMSSECAATLGIAPFMGRLIDDSDQAGTSAAAPVVVVGHEFWRRHLSSDPGIVGRTLNVDGFPLTVIGVMPAEFTGLNVEQATALTVPLGLFNRLLGGQPNAPVLAMHAVGRLQPGVTLEQADARLRSSWTALWDAVNAAPPGQRAPAARDVASLRVDSLATGLSLYRTRYQLPLQVLVGLALTLIALASINVANLFLVRTDAREHEIAVQLALGAGHARVGWRLVAEALLLSGTGGVLAIPIAWWLSEAIARMLWTSIYPMTARLTPDGVVVGAMVAVALVAGMVLAAPSLLAARFRVGPLRTGEGRSVFSTMGRWRRALVVAQVASATVLLFTSGIFLRSLLSVQRLDPGYAANGLSWAAMQRVPRAPGGGEGAYALEIINQVSGVAGVRSAAMSSTFPTFDLRMLVSQTPLRATPAAPEIAGYVDRISPGFFDTTGISLRRGRDFDWQDETGKPRVAIINTALAEKLFPGGDALGQPIRVGAQMTEMTVVGIAETASPGDPRISALPILYQPLLQSPALAPRLLVRSDRRAGLLADLDRAVRPLGRHYRVVLRTVDEQFDIFLARERALALLSATFAGVGVLVGGLGIYAVLAHAVSRRTRELGVRLALGAAPARLVTMVLRDGARMLVAGLVIGVPLAMWSGRVATALLFEPPPFDSVVLGAVVAGLAAVVAAAGLLPALRAARLDPSQALRHD